MKSVKVKCAKCGNQGIAWLSKAITDYKLKCAKCGSESIERSE